MCSLRPLSKSDPPTTVKTTSLPDLFQQMAQTRDPEYYSLTLVLHKLVQNTERHI